MRGRTGVSCSPGPVFFPAYHCGLLWCCRLDHTPPAFPPIPLRSLPSQLLATDGCPGKDVRAELKGFLPGFSSLCPGREICSQETVFFKTHLEHSSSLCPGRDICSQETGRFQNSPGTAPGWDLMPHVCTTPTLFQRTIPVPVHTNIHTGTHAVFIIWFVTGQWVEENTISCQGPSLTPLFPLLSVCEFQAK